MDGTEKTVEACSELSQSPIQDIVFGATGRPSYKGRVPGSNGWSQVPPCHHPAPHNLPAAVQGHYSGSSRALFGAIKGTIPGNGKT